MDYFQDIRYSCIKHFPDGFVSNKVSPSHTCDSLKKKEFRKSFTSMSDLQKRLNEIGEFATLRKSKTMDAELSRKVQSDHISRKLQGTSKIARKLQKYDNLSWQEFLLSVRNTRVPLSLTNPTRGDLIIYLTGDIALSSLDVKTLKEAQKVFTFCTLYTGTLHCIVANLFHCREETVVTTESITWSLIHSWAARRRLVAGLWGIACSGLWRGSQPQTMCWSASTSGCAGGWRKWTRVRLSTTSSRSTDSFKIRWVFYGHEVWERTGANNSNSQRLLCNTLCDIWASLRRASRVSWWALPRCWCPRPASASTPRPGARPWPVSWPPSAARTRSVSWGQEQSVTIICSDSLSSTATLSTLWGLSFIWVKEKVLKCLKGRWCYQDSAEQTAGLR